MSITVYLVRNNELAIFQLHHATDKTDDVAGDLAISGLDAYRAMARARAFMLAVHRIPPSRHPRLSLATMASSGRRK